MKEDLIQILPAIPLDSMTLLEEVGRGARSIVYRATHQGQEYAVKFFFGGAVSPESIRLFRREAAIHASLRHPAIPIIFDVGEHQGRPYIVSELIKGNTLSERLATGRLSIAETLKLACTVASVLKLIHRNGLVHRDIKPRNILVDDQGAFKLIDFGLAEQDSFDNSGCAVGTFRYSAPEQAGMLERPVDGRADLYSLGVVLFECLVGTPPFEAEDIADLLHQHAAMRPPPVQSLRSDCPARLSALVARLLEKDPDERPASAQEVLTNVRNMASDPTLLAPARQSAPQLLLPLIAESDGGSGQDSFVGREAELRLLDSIHTSLSQNNGGILLMTGPVGSGKTRLIERAVDGFEAQGTQVLRAKCRSSDPFPLGPIRDALHLHLSASPRPTHGTTGAAEGDPSIASAGNTNTEPLESASARILSKEQEAEGARAVHNETTLFALLNSNTSQFSDAPEQFFHALGDYLFQMSEASGKLFLWIDDAQWLDQTTIDALSIMASRLHQSSLFLILSARKEDGYLTTLRSLERRLSSAHVRRIELEPLSERQIHSWLTERLGAPLSSEFVDQITQLSQGNPLAVWQYILTLRDGGALIPRWGRWVVDERLRSDLPFPNDLCTLVVSQARMLSDACKEVLSVGAMQGLQFDPECLLPILAKGTYRDVQQALMEAREAHLIERVPNSQYVIFVHDTVRETLRQYMPFSEEVFHRRAADVLDQQAHLDGRQLFERAHHYIHGYYEERPHDTFLACLDGAVQAVTDHAYPHAWELLTFAGNLNILPEMSPATRLSYHRTRGGAAFNTDRIDEAISQLQLAVELCSEPHERAILREQLIRAAVFTFNTKVGTEEMEKAFQELGLFLPSAHIKDPALLQAHLLSMMQQNDALLDSGEGYGSAQGMSIDQYKVVIRLCDSGFLIGYYTRNMPFAMQCGILSVVPSFMLGDTLESCQGFATYAFMLGLLGQKAKVFQYVDRTLSLAKRLNTPQAMGVALCQSGLAHHLVGNSELALQYQREAFEQYGRWLTPILYQNCVVDLSWNAYIRGYSEEDLTVSQTSLQRLQHQRGTFMAGYVCRASSAAMASAATLGQYRLAAQYLREVEELRALIPADRPVPWVSVAGYKVNYYLTQQDFGAEFEEAVAQHRAWQIPPQRSTLHSKQFYVGHAYARLYMLRRQRMEEYDQTLANLRNAVADLELTATTETLKAHLMVLKANLSWIDGDWQGAWRILDDARLLTCEVDNPWAMYEESVTRALMLRERGHLKAMAMEIVKARQIAVNGKWHPRIHWLQATFQSEASTSTQVLEPVQTHTQTSVIGGKLSQLQRQLDALLSLSRASASVLDPDALARIALDESARILGAERAFLFVMNGPNRELEFQCGRNAAQQDLLEPTAYSRTVLQRVLLQGRPVILSTRSDAAALESESVVAYDLRSVLAAPLCVADQVQGVIYLDNRMARGFFSQDHAELLRAMGGYIATALQTANSARLKSQLQVEQERRRLAETLRELQSSLTATLNLNEGLARLLHALSRELVFDQALIVIQGDSKVEFCVSSGFPSDEIPGFYHDMPLLAQQLTEQEVQILGPEAASPEGKMCGILIPLISRCQTIGSVLLLRPAQRPFNQNDVELGSTLVAQAGIAIENARLFTRVKTLAERDGLTGLYNRREFFRQAEQMFHSCATHDTPLAAVMFDVDHFKRFNDVYGHAVGDQVLKLVSQVTSECVRRTDVVGRYGGEEFAVMLPQATPRIALEVAERIRFSIEQRYLGHPGVGNLSVTVSIGIAYRTENDDLHTMLSRADRALYVSKRRGRNTVSYLTNDEDLATQN